MKTWAKINFNNIVEDIYSFEDGVTPLQQLPNGWKWVCDNDDVKNTPCIGGSYDDAHKAFIFEKPYNSWILNQEDFNWYAPVEKPTTTKTVTIEGNQITIPDTYVWNELTTSWDKLS
jgi:hypothetical protein